MKNTSRNFFVTFGILGVFLMSHSAKASDQESAQDNAAVYYLKAVQSWQKPSNSARAEVSNIVQYGWYAGQGDVEYYLFKNKQCLEEIVRAAEVKNCDFSFGEKTGFAKNADPDLFKLLELNNLLLLSARYYQKQKEVDKSAEICLASFSFTRHIAQGKGILFKVISLAFETRANGVIKTCIRSPLLTAEEKNRMRRYLQEYWGSHYTLSDFIREARDEFLITIEQLVSAGITASGISLLSPEGNPFLGRDFYAQHKRYSVDPDFGRAISRRANMLARYYYDPLIEVASRVEGGNAEQLTQDLKVLERKLVPKLENGFVIFIKAGWIRLQSREKAIELWADVIMQQMLFPGFSGSHVLSRFTDKYTVLLKERTKLKKALAP